MAHWCDNHIRRGAPGWALIDFGCGRGRPHGSLKPLLPSAKARSGCPRHLCSLSVFVGPILLYFEHSSSGDVVRDLLQEALAFLQASSERLDDSLVSLAPLHQGATSRGSVEFPCRRHQDEFGKLTPKKKPEVGKVDAAAILKPE